MQLITEAQVRAILTPPADAQALREAGEFRRAAPGVIRPERVAELGALLAAPRPRGEQDIVVYKSVGIGLEDVAIAHWVYQQLHGGDLT